MFSKRFILLLMLVVCTYVKAVTVNALCPTNKIAPHKRFAEWDQSRGRTFGLFQHLLTPNNHHYNDPNDLQEQPQEDPDDCGEIEDYDKNDLSSVTYPQSQRRKEYGNKEYGYRPNRHTTHRPSRPHSLTRPSYSSGGYFENNNYTPQSPQRPSDKFKPVNENRPEYHFNYDPQIVGGPLGHVVGFSPVRPTRYPRHDPGTRPSKHVRFPPQNDAQSNPNRPSPRRFDENTIFGSFVDLFLK